MTTPDSVPERQACLAGQRQQSGLGRGADPSSTYVASIDGLDLRT